MFDDLVCVSKTHSGRHLGAVQILNFGGTICTQQIETRFPGLFFVVSSSSPHYLRRICCFISLMLLYSAQCHASITGRFQIDLIT